MLLLQAAPVADVAKSDGAETLADAAATEEPAKVEETPAEPAKETETVAAATEATPAAEPVAEASAAEETKEEKVCLLCSVIW
jgi:hypothetical protein